MPLQLSDHRPLEPEELTAQWSDGDLEEDEESWDEDLDEDWDDVDEDLEGDDWDEDLDEGEELEVDLEAGDDWWALHGPACFFLTPPPGPLSERRSSAT